jgi:hypothetical protein
LGARPKKLVLKSAGPSPRPEVQDQLLQSDDPRHDLPRQREGEGTLLISAGVPVKVVNERLGHATPSFTIETYQHVLPGMQAQAARVFEQLVALGALPDGQRPEKSEKTRENRRRKTA